MANTIVLKRSATPGKVPTAAQLALGEIAINTYDGLIYIKKDDGTPSVVQIGGVTSVNGETGALTISSDDISDSGQTNKWFSNALARGAVSAGTGISYNSGTGVISTSQSITTSASPTFAGLTLTGGISSIAGSIIPSADVTYDLGSPEKQWKDIYVGPGSLYVNGSKVLQDDTGTITFSADTDQNIRIKTTGNGILQLGSSSTLLQVDSTLQITSGKNITDSSGIKVNFGDNIEMNGNKVIGLGAPSSANDAATKSYVDTAVSAISTSSIETGNSNISVTDTGTGTVTVTVDGSTALTVTSSGVVVAGNFTVQGTTTTVESNTIALADNIITLNSDATGTPTSNAGIEVERGDDANVQIRWNEGTDKWTFTNDGSVYYPVAVSTADLVEDPSATSTSGTQYFTTSRARQSISSSSSTGVSYNSTTGAISLGSIPNSSLANSAVTIGSTSTSLGSTTTTLAGLSSVTSSSFTGALTGNADTATKLATARTLALTGDATASGSFDGSANYSQALTLATVNSNVGQFGSATAIPVVTVNAKGLVTAVSTTAVSIPSGALTFTGDVTGTGTTGSSTALTIKTSPTLTTPTLSGTTTIGGHLIPSTDLTYDLGDATHRFRNLYLSGSTIAIAGSTSGTLTLASPAVAGTTTVTFPATTGTVITTGDTSTVTNTMLAGSIANAKLANSTISGVSLGSNLNALTIGTGLSGSSYNGSGAVTVAIDSTVTTLTGTQTLTSKTLTSPAITTPTVTGATVMKTGSTSVADEYVTYTSLTATTAGQVLDTLATANYTSVRYTIEAINSSAVEMVEVTLTFFGSNVYMNETALVSSSATFQASYDGDISGGNLRLLATPTNANTKFKVRATAFKVI